MPVRIYDIAKKLGLENKFVLNKAKELGISAAKVPSSSLDKITAEYLEKELGGLAVTPPPTPAAHYEPVVIISAPAEPPPAAEPEPASEAPAEDALADASAPGEEAPAPEAIEGAGAPTAPAEPAKPTPPPEPPKPVGPQIGDKVGFIQLPTRPAPAARQPERPPEQRGGAPQRPGQPMRRDDNRGGGRDDRGRGQFGRQPGLAPRPAAPAAPKPPALVLPADARVITMKPPIIVRDIADQLKQKAFKIIADLMELGVFATVNQAIDEAIALKLCGKYGVKFEIEKRERGAGIVHAPIKKVEEKDTEDKPEQLKARPPVVTIMGHVDHGKTTLLDVIRKANVAAGEAGGITQHIGAYTITVPHPEKKGEQAPITFLDTPGHAAFSAMRARGANVTDIVILVVAANDGVMPQTLEALSHAQAAKVPIIVAVNKCDHPNANPMKVRQQLQEKGLVPDDWGGETIYVDVSALTKMNIEKLLEMIIFQADLLDLKANPERRAKGNVIESGLEPGGPTATVLVRKGTLRVGEVVVCGQYYGKVRALISEEGKRLKEAGPSVAVKLLGLNGVPEAGLEFSVVVNEKDAREICEQREMDAKNVEKEARPAVTLENLFATLAAEQAKMLKVVVKADTQGSVEAIVEALKKIDTQKVSLDIIHSAVGTVTESDVLLSSASKAIILGFHTRVDTSAAETAKREGVQIKLYSIIYELIDEVKEAMAGLLEPSLKEVVVGAAEVRQIFELSKGGSVAGCVVAHGRIVKGKVRITRRKSVIYEGLTQSLRRFQDEVNEVRAGMECGIRIDGFNEFQTGDMIECYTIEKTKQAL